MDNETDDRHELEEEWYTSIVAADVKRVRRIRHTHRLGVGPRTARPAIRRRIRKRLNDGHGDPEPTRGRPLPYQA
jgi:hypothetical protein